MLYKKKQSRVKRLRASVERLEKDMLNSYYIQLVNDGNNPEIGLPKVVPIKICP